MNIPFLWARGYEKEDPGRPRASFIMHAGFTALNAVNAPTASGEIAVGLNVDLGRHWGIDALAFAPVGASDTGPSVLLDIRYAF